MMEAIIETHAGAFNLREISAVGIITPAGEDHELRIILNKRKRRIKIKVAHTDLEKMISFRTQLIEAWKNYTNQ